MAKFSGYIGIVKTEETSPGIWETVNEEKHVCGNMNRLSRNYVSSEQLNGKVTLNSQISIVSSPYILDNCQYIAYVRFRNTNWEVTSIDIQYPELILTVGGVYNEAEN